MTEESSALTSNLDVSRLLRENKKLVKFNEDLRQQVELLTAKLLIHQRVDRKSYASKAVQTTEMTGSNERIVIATSSSISEDNVKGWQSTNDKRSIAELVTEVAEQNVSSNDYIYDAKTKTYSSRSTGWYFYPERNLFYNPHDEKFYSYDEKTKTYDFYSNKNDKPSKAEVPTSENVISVDSSDEEEDGELLSDNDYDIEILEKPKTFSYDSAPPARLIVLESNQLDEGSLLIASSIGSSIGSHPSCSINLIGKDIDEKHAIIKFDIEKQAYELLKDSESSLTYVNGLKLEDNTVSLFHGDILEIGSYKLLLHVHAGRDVTCVHCEPGCVKANLDSIDHRSVQLEKVDRKTMLNQLKRKYGLQQEDYIPVKIFLSNEYKDRASERRKLKGIDNVYAKTEASSVHQTVSKKNKGFKMLQSLGWSEGKALGKNEDGQLEPIMVEQKDSRAGLGAIPSMAKDRCLQKPKNIWVKAQERFKQIDEAK